MKCDSDVFYACRIDVMHEFSRTIGSSSRTEQNLSRNGFSRFSRVFKQNSSKPGDTQRQPGKCHSSCECVRGTSGGEATRQIHAIRLLRGTVPREKAPQQCI